MTATVARQDLSEILPMIVRQGQAGANTTLAPMTRSALILEQYFSQFGVRVGCAPRDEELELMPQYFAEVAA